MIGPLSFGEPLSLALLVVLIPLALLVRLEVRRREAARAAYGGSEELRLGARSGRQRVRLWMLGLAVVLLVVAIARPQWGSTDAPAERRGVDIAIALDVSRSMTATDAVPSRAVAASEGIGEFLVHLRSDRVGLVIFSGRAFERSPLTLDLEALGQLVSQAQRDSELVGRGTDLGGAIDEALALLDVPDAADSQLMIVVSDGEDLGEAALVAAGRAAAADVPIFTVAVGTSAGASIPGDAATLDLSRADRATLRAVADATGGEFRELDTIAGLAIEAQRLRQSAFDDDSGRQPIERFQWFLVPALILLLLPMLIGEAGGSRQLTRRHLGATALLGLLTLGACGGSQLYQLVEDGNEAFALERFDEALASYREAQLADPTEPVVGYNVGNTLHELRRYEEATIASSEALGLTEDPELTVLLRYALGNHAVMREALEDARRYYIDVLRLAPNDEDAKANLELVLAQIAPPPPVEPPIGEGPDEQPDGVPGDEPGEPGDNPGAGNGDSPDGEPGDTPPGDGSPDDTPPDDGGDPTPSDGSGADAPPTDSTPGDTSDGGELGDGSDPSGGGADQPGGVLTLQEAQAALDEALAELGEELTLEEAATLLELIRQLSEVEPLDPIRPSGGGFSDR